MILASLIDALHFGHEGRSIAAIGTTDKRCWDWGTVLPPMQAGAQHSLSPPKCLEAER